MDFVSSAALDDLEDQAGDLLRVVLSYRGGEWDELYVRDDLQDALGPNDQTKVSTLMQVENRVVLSEEWPTDVGDLHATVRVFENVVVINFPHGPDRGVAVSMDPLAALQLDEFIDRYRNDLFEPQK